MMKLTKEDALEYHHLNGVPGKISIQPTKPLETQRDLSLAYTPGVAHPVLEIERDVDLAYEYTSKGNLVAVISNGTAILGLGNRGAMASKPVMEGKCVLFKKFGAVDAIDIEVETRDPDELINVVVNIGRTFGGINLEDIRSPECFKIETECQKRLDIPVFHDDQHGTAIIIGAAVLNAMDLLQKKIDQIKVVFSGAGAAGISSARMLVRLGVPKKNIFMCDIDGLVFPGRDRPAVAEREDFANGSAPAVLADVIRDADVFIGLSAANVVSEEMVKSMNSKPVIFAMANPDPEIRYELAKKARPDAIVATGRSDYPNQINNVLGFPYIFRGALDVRSKAINDDMKIAASYALADLARQPVPQKVLQAYNLEHLEFGLDYFVPKPFDPRALTFVSSAVAKASMDSGLARIQINLDEYKQRLDAMMSK